MWKIEVNVRNLGLIYKTCLVINSLILTIYVWDYEFSNQNIISIKVEGEFSRNYRTAIIIQDEKLFV